MDLAAHLQTSARANRLAQHRLQGAMAGLSRAEFHAPRTGFFPSLAATLNHVLAVDIYYIAALLGEADMVAQYQAFVPCDDLAALTQAQARSDDRLIRYCDALTPATVNARVVLDRGHERQFNTAAQTLAHLFMHQTHHRGQAHAMLSGTMISPPQLDEFLLPSDAACRAADMQALGWAERDLFGPR